MVRIAARPSGVTRVDVTHEAVQLQFMKNPPLDGAKVINFIRKKGRHARLAGPEKLRVDAKLPAWQERAAAVKDILQELPARKTIGHVPDSPFWRPAPGARPRCRSHRAALRCAVH